MSDKLLIDNNDLDSENRPKALTTTANVTLQQYVQAATADNTRKTYRSVIRQFEKWGGRLPTHQHELVRYLLERAEVLNPRTLDLHMTALSQWHHVQGMADPTRDPLVRKTLEGIRRTHSQPKQAAKALRLGHIIALLKKLDERPDDLKTYRDRALILVGYFGAFRRSELVSIQVEDLTWEPEGVLIQLPRSKTDQQASGVYRALPFGPQGICPALALKTWMEQAKITSGPVFRAINRWGQMQPKALAAGSVNTLLKQLGKACQFDFTAQLSSHSLRRGMATAAAREKVGFELIKKQGGWKSDATVWHYIEAGEQFQDNAANILMRKMQTLMEQG